MKRRLLLVLLGVVGFVGSLLLGVLLHVRVPVARRVAQTQVTKLLATVLQGRIELDGLEGLSLSGIEGAHVTVKDPDGVRVITVDHLDAHISLVDVIRNVLGGGSIVVDHIHIANADVNLDLATDGNLRMVNAFMPRLNPGAPVSSGPPPIPKLRLTDIVTDHAWGHGTMKGQIIDADADRIGSEVRIGPKGVEVDLDQATIVTRAAPKGANARGQARGWLAFDMPMTLRAAATFEGDAGEIPLKARAAIDGADMLALVDVPPVKGERVRRLIAEAPIYDVIFAHFEGSGTLRAMDFAGLVGVGAGRVRATGRYVAPSLEAHVAIRNLDPHTLSLKAPNTTVAGDFDIHTNMQDVDGKGRATLPGATIDLNASLQGDVIEGRTEVVVLDGSKLASTMAPTMKVQGHGDVVAQGRLDTQSHVLAASAHGVFRGLGGSGVSIATMAFDVRANGDMKSPAITLGAQARDLQRADMRLSELDADVHGSLDSADVTVCAIGRGQVDLTGHVSLPPGGVRVERLQIMGVGEPIVGSASWLEGQGHVAVVSRDIDLSRVHTLLGMQQPLEGNVVIDADVRLSADRIQGIATVDASRLEFAEIHAGGLHVEVAAIGNTWAVSARAHESRFGWVSVETNDLQPTGSPMSPASWRAARGTVRIDTETSLSAIQTVAPAFVASGQARAGVTISRDSATLPPDVVLTVETRQLSVGLSNGEVSGINLTALAHLAPEGQLVVHAEARQPRAEVAIADLVATVPYAAMLHGDFRRELLKEAPFKLDATIPKRKGDAICTWLGTSCEGNLEAVVHLEGTSTTPHGTVHAAVENFRGTLSPVVVPMSAIADGSYDLKSAQIKVHATTSPEQSLDAHAEVTDPTTNWVASLAATLHDFPLGAPGKFDIGLRARVNGDFALTNYHQDARVRADLHFDDIDSEGTKLGHADIKAGFDGSKLSAAVHMQQVDGDADFLSEANALWGARLKPILDEAVPATLSARAHHLRIKAAQVLVSNTFEELDGWLEADAKASLSHGSALAVNGWASIREGSLHSASFGEVHGIQGKVSMKNDGSLRLEGGRAQGMTGEMTVAGEAHLNNGVIQDVTISPQITKSNAFPLILDGQHVGDVWGALTVVVKPQGTGWNIDTQVPSLHFILPEAGQRAVQKLDSEPEIAIGTRGHGQFVPLAIGAPVNSQPRVVAKAAPSRLVVHLGDDVEVSQGRTLSVYMSGNPTVEFGDELKVMGQIQIVRGRLDVEGKSFDVDRGTVTFTGDPQNPIVVVTASWLAADGTQVYADYTGPLQSGKVTLRSEPARPHNEIVSLLVFGTADGPNSGGPGSDTPTKAVGAGAAYAAQPFNKAIDQLTHADISARVDTTSQNPKPEVEVQIAKNISAMVSVVLGVPSPTQAPDVYWLTLAWRLKTRWTLEAKVGDRGSSILDLFWQYRY